MFTSIDGVIDKFKRQPVPPEIPQAAPVHQPDVYQQHPAAAAPAAAATYQAAQPAACAAAQYAAPAYNAGAYPNAQYAAYPQQQQYQQPYAAAANGTQPSQGKWQLCLVMPFCLAQCWWSWHTCCSLLGDEQSLRMALCTGFRCRCAMYQKTGATACSCLSLCHAVLQHVMPLHDLRVSFDCAGCKCNPCDPSLPSEMQIFVMYRPLVARF